MCVCVCVKDINPEQYHKGKEGTVEGRKGRNFPFFSRMVLFEDCS